MDINDEFMVACHKYKHNVPSRIISQLKISSGASTIKNCIEEFKVDEIKKTGLLSEQEFERLEDLIASSQEFKEYVRHGSKKDPQFYNNKNIK